MSDNPQEKKAPASTTYRKGDQVQVGDDLGKVLRELAGKVEVKLGKGPVVNVPVADVRLVFRPSS